MPTQSPSGKTQTRLDEARRLEKLSQAEWRRRRAEVARLIAAGEEAAARRLLAEIGECPPDERRDTAAEPLWEGSPDPDHAPPAVTATKPQSGSGDPSHKQRAALAPKTSKHSVAAPLKSPQPKPTPCEPGSVSSRSEPPKRAAAKTVATKNPAPKSVTAQLKSSRRPKRRRRPKTWLAWFKSRPPWVTSLTAHSATLTLFAMLTFATFGEQGFSLTATFDDSDSWEDISSEVTLTNLEVESESDIDPPTELPTDVTVDVPLESLVEPAELTNVNTLGQMLSVSAESLMAAVPGGGETEGKGEGAASAAGGGAESGGGAGKVSFFGAEAEAERIVFVVDNSGSMQHGRMQVTLLELAASIRRLSESQHFYVVFFSDQAYPMFFPKNVMETLPATQENKKATMQWLRTVEMCLGGRLLDAMDFAIALKPDVVFLLTDGDIRSPRVIERMTAKDAWGFPIHTLGMGARTPQHAQILQAIADASGGTARPVFADPTAVARARAKPIPYHNRPGTVWGSAVQAWEP
jgi:hypothetical protein